MDGKKEAKKKRRGKKVRVAELDWSLRGLDGGLIEAKTLNKIVGGLMAGRQTDWLVVDCQHMVTVTFHLKVRMSTSSSSQLPSLSS